MSIFVISFFPQTGEARNKRPARAYSYFDDNGKANQGVCDAEGKIPKRLKRQKEFSKSSGYLGSEKQESELKSEMISWKHFFKTSAACNQYLFKAQNQK